MSALRPHVPFDDRETHVSFAGRLAATHTGQPMRTFLSGLGIDPTGFSLGRDDELRSLASIAGVDPRALTRNAFQPGGLARTFRGDRCSRYFAEPKPYRICPTCVRETMGGRDLKVMLEWSFNALRSCSLHGTILEHLGAHARHDLRDVPAGRIGEANRKETVRHDEAPSYALWLVDRLHGVPENDEWMLGQSLEQVIGFSAVLGTVLLHDRHTGVQTLSAEDREVATEKGFGIFSQGPEALREVFDDLFRTQPAMGAQRGPRAGYGQVFTWLDRRSGKAALGALGDVLFRHVVRRYSYKGGRYLLGQRVPERETHTLKSFAEAAGVSRKKALRILRINKLIPVREPEQVTSLRPFPPHAVNALIYDYRHSVPLEELAEYLGTTQSMAMSLYRRGFLPAVDRGDRKELRRILFSKRELDGVIKTIRRLPLVTEDDQKTHASIASICQSRKIPADDLLREVLSGRRPAKRVRGTPTLDAVRILRNPPS